MNRLVRNQTVDADLQQVREQQLFSWNALKGASILVTGATGIIGSFIIRCLLYANFCEKLNLRVIASARNRAKTERFFAPELKQYADTLILNIGNIEQGIHCHEPVNYIIHAACPTDSSFFVEHPQETRNIIIHGTQNMLEFACEKRIQGMVYLSSMEALGVTPNADLLSESELGEIDETIARNSYPSAKRRAEALCAEYARNRMLPVRVARLAQILGACANYDDCRVYAYFVRCVLTPCDIVLKTSGRSLMSSCYITDTVCAMLLLLLHGKLGGVYHVANQRSARRIIDVAQMLAHRSHGTKVLIEPEHSNYVDGVSWNMSTDRLQSLGWCPNVELEDAYTRLIASFSQQMDVLKRTNQPHE